MKKCYVNVKFGHDYERFAFETIVVIKKSFTLKINLVVCFIFDTNYSF